MLQLVGSGGFFVFKQERTKQLTPYLVVQERTKQLNNKMTLDLWQ